MKGVQALRGFFVAGAVVDALATAALLSPTVARTVLGVDVPVTSALLYAMRTGTSLMLGWTCLLVWATLPHDKSHYEFEPPQAQAALRDVRLYRRQPPAV